MKNLLKLFGVTALVAVIGFSFVSCGEGGSGGNGSNMTVSGEGGGNGFNMTVSPTSGRLTITGLGNYNGKCVVAISDTSTKENPYLYAADNMNSNLITAGKISGGSVTLSVWGIVAYSEDSVSASNYSGNDSNVKFDILIFGTQVFSSETTVPIDEQLIEGTATANFTNGVATNVSFTLRP